MIISLAETSGAVASSLVFAFLCLPSGYLLTSWNLLSLSYHSEDRRNDSFLWSAALGTPASLAIAAILGRILPPRAILGIFPLLAAAAILHVFLRLRSRPPAPPPRPRVVPPLLLPIAILSVYLVLATAPLHFGPHLFEAVSASDWSIRLPLLGASIRDGVPPGNPFFAVAAHPQPTRYYFYWYSLCAQVARLTGLPPRACLSGSTVWAGVGLVSILLLLLEQFTRSATHACERQRRIALGLCCVMGIDILPAIAGLLAHPLRLTPEIEWWRDDRIPSFLGALIFAPHHIGGMVAAAAGLLVVARLSQSQESTGIPHPRTARASVLATGAVAGLCFAATAGTSTYLALCFACIGLLYGLDLLWQRQWSALAALLVSGIVAVALSLPFLHTMLHSPALASTGGVHHLFKLTVRNLGEARHIITYLAKHAHRPPPTRGAQVLLGLPFLAVLSLLEPGFFVIPLLVRTCTDLRRLRHGRGLTPGERLLWACFLGALVPALFLSSEPTQQVNDLGRHAGLILRLVLILWAVPLVDQYLTARRQARLARRHADSPATPRSHSAVAAAAAVLLVLGILSQIWQIVLDRTFLVLAESRRFNPEPPFMADTDLAARYFDLHQGAALLDQTLPPHAVVQSNVGSRYQLVALLYMPRQTAAGDISCEAAFGGDPSLCAPMVRQLERLFGGPPDKQPAALAPFITQIAPDAAQTTTPAAFREACRDLHLDVLIAQNSDPAWSFPASWVWQPALYATPRVRFLRCPVPD